MIRTLIIDAVISAAVAFIIRKAFEILEEDMAEMRED